MSFARLETDDDLIEGVVERRAAAWCIDVVLIGIIAAVAFAAIVIVGLLTFGFGFVLLGWLPPIGLVYHTLFVAGPRAATPGMRLMDLSVRHEADLGPPSLLQAIVFTAGLWLTLTFAFFLLLAPLVTVRKRALHDIVAGVLVVRNRALTARLASMNMGDGTPLR